MEEREEDRISALPDCLLIEILSRLPSTKDAIRTGTLSKRWKRLWTLVPTLIFEHEEDIYDFVLVVDKTVTQCRQLKLKKFVLYAGYDIQFEPQVNNLIRYAIRCNVEELDLQLWHMGFRFNVKFPVDQTFFVSPCFINLTLEGCMLNPIGAISWKNLRSLCISNVNLDKVLIEKILSGSPQLETLVLNDCSGFRRLDIATKSVKKLVFSGYMDPDNVFRNDIIEINAPNILSLTIEGHLISWNLLLVNVSSLVEANLNYTRGGYYEATADEEEEKMLKGFILKLLHVKDLKIGVWSFMVMSRLKAKGFDFPSNMSYSASLIYNRSVEAVGDWSNSDSVESGDWDVLFRHGSKGFEVN